MKKLVSLLLLVISVVSYSKEKKIGQAAFFTEFRYPIKDFSSLEIKAENLKFKVTGESKFHRFTLYSGVTEEIKKEIKDGKLLLSWLDPNNKKPLVIHYQGKLSALKTVSKKLNMEIKDQKEMGLVVKAESANILSSGNEGVFGFFFEKGSLNLSKHKGDVRLESYGVKTQLDEVEGNLALRNFAGVNMIRNITGNLSFVGNQGSLELDKLEGKINFESHSANMIVRGLKGEIRGKAKLGNIKLFLEESNRVRLRAKESKVNLYMPKNSGSHVNIGTGDGDLRFPKYLEMKRYPTVKVATGRLRGRLGGSVFVRTEKGDIKLIQR